MNKKGFTLMELLLVVAILAIVAAAAAPTFTSGAGDALKEARKSAFLGAYQNAVTGAHMMVAIAAAKAIDIVNTNLDTTNDGATENAGVGADKHNLDYYSPKSTRQFKNNAGKQYYCGARVDTDHKLFITYYTVADNDTTGFNATQEDINMYQTGKTSTKVLDEAWDAINSAN